ncbi:MAG: class I SAM-dependent RNA methyltransferase, partial [Clostridia bacterium]|nr:class I SAM-dependent RNA methyltransferase [Clostridia bacterium]
MKNIRIAAFLSALLLAFISCSASGDPPGKLIPDVPGEGVGRVPVSASDPLEDLSDPAGEQGAEDSDTVTVTGDIPEGSLAPFGAIRWRIEDGIYRYDIPEQNTSGMATVDEMYTFPTTRFEDANQPPDVDNWYPGDVVYDETTGQGLLRHIYVREGAVSGQLMVCLVVNGERLPRENRLVHALRREIPGLASVILSVNRKNTNVVLGSEFRTLWGQDWIEDELCGFTFRLSPRSFYQVNHDQAQRLYETAVDLADLHGTETVLDLYCGTGTITLALSRKAGRAVGVEVVPQAVEDAKENAARNGITNT